MLFDHVEVLGVALPAPGHALGEGRAGNVLDALHQADQPILFTRPYRGEANSAVACDHSGDPVPAGRFQQAVPADLTVVVRVDVDEAGRDDLPGRVDRLGRIAFQRGASRPAATNLHDLAVPDGHIGLEPVRARPVDNGSACDLEVEHDYSLELHVSRYGGQCNTVTDE
jgi:hypothetical protein